MTVKEYDLEEVLSRYLAGEDHLVLGREFGLHRTTIPNLLRRRGIPIRSIERRRHFVNHYALNDLSLESALYWCGFIFADGYVSKRQNSGFINLGLAIRDLDHLNKFRGFFGSTQSIDQRGRLGGYGSPICSTNIFSNVLYDKLIQFGRYSGDLDRRLWASRHFWRGAIDGDGCLVLSKRRDANDNLYFYPSVSLCGEYWIVDAFKRRFLLSGHDSKACVVPQSSIFTYTLTGPVAVDCIRWLYGDATVYLDRKYETAQRILREYG